MFFMWGLYMLHRRNWTRETEPFWFILVKRYKYASVLNNLTTVHYTCIQTTELRRIKRMWVENICLSVCVCFSGKNKTTRCMRGTSTVATTVQTSSCVQMASLCGNEQLRERSGLHLRQLPTAETSSGKNKQSFLLLPVKVICAAGRLWRAVRTWRRRYFILKTISNTLSAVDEFDPVNLSRWLNKCSCNRALICKISMLNSIRHKTSD